MAGLAELNAEGASLPRRCICPGHAPVFEKGKRQCLTHHYHDGEDRGLSKLRLVPLE